MKTPFLALALAASLSALAADPSQPNKPEPKDHDTDVIHAICPQMDKPGPAVQSAMIVVRDAQTGKLRPATGEEAAALAATAARQSLTPASESSVLRKSDGSKMVRLNGQYFSTVVARKKDGKVEQDCFSDPAAAKRFVEEVAHTACAER